MPRGQSTHCGLVPVSAAPEHVPCSCWPAGQSATTVQVPHTKGDVALGSATVYWLPAQNGATLQYSWPVWQP